MTEAQYEKMADMGLDEDEFVEVLQSEYEAGSED